MMTIGEIRKSLEGLLTPARFAHSLGVMKTAKELALHYDVDSKKAAMAGLIHDCARSLTLEKQLKKADNMGILLDEIQRRETILIHGPLGALLARQYYGIDDNEILRAVEIHTTGDEGMSELDKVVFLADYIEPLRDFPGVEDLRAKATVDLDLAVISAFDSTIKYVLSEGGLLHPKTLAGRNDILLGGES